MADNKISNLPTTSALTLSDLLEVEQPAQTAGTRSRKSPISQLLALIFDDDPTLAGDSDDKAATQAAVKAFVANAIALAIAGLDPNASIGVQFVADTSSTTDADPGAGKIRWNHATQDSATVLFLDDATADGASLTAIWPRLNAGGVVFLQHATNQDIWQIWEFTAINDASGYAKLTVTKWGTNGTFANGDPILVTLDKGQDGSVFTGGSLTSALNEAKATNIASASTTDIGAATGNLVHITGTTTITALGTIQAGTSRTVVFDGALTLTHNATSLILPTGANIATAAGDVAMFRSEGSGNWRCVGYMRASGQSLVPGRQAIAIACSDETTALTAGTNKVKFINPYSTAFNVLAVVASLTVPQTSGSIFTVDINEAGATILSTKLTIDNTESNSSTAATAAVISDASIAAFAEMSVDIDQIGDGTAKGLKVYLIGYPS